MIHESTPDLTILAWLVNNLIDHGGEPLYHRTIARRKPFLNSNEVRELLLRGELDSPNTPRPAPKLIANQTTAILHTYHRARVSSPTKKLAGEWTPRVHAITLNPRIAQVLLTRFTGSLTSENIFRLNRVANGWKSGQRTPKSKQQALYA